MSAMVDFAAGMLAPTEREAVLGDLAESGEGTLRSVIEIVGLALRRHAALWTGWRPWLAGVGVAVPGSFALMGFSVAVSLAAQSRFGYGIDGAVSLASHANFATLASQGLLFLLCSWTMGYAIGSISRRTLWASAVLCAAPCLFCLSRFRVETLPCLSLLLFLPPAMLGVRLAMRRVQIKPIVAVSIAVTVTLLMRDSWGGNGPWMLNLALLWPAWYLAAARQRQIRLAPVLTTIPLKPPR
jgi:hypothetical protein